MQIYYVWLKAEYNEQTRRERTLKKALDKMKKRPAILPSSKRPTSSTKSDSGAPSVPPPGSGTNSLSSTNAAKLSASQERTKALLADLVARRRSVSTNIAKVTIDFDGIEERIRRITNKDVTESGLLWSPDSKRLAFGATVDGKRGTYTVSFPEPSKPALMAPVSGSRGRWLKKSDQITWLVEGVPATLSGRGTAVSYRFSAPQTIDVAGKNRAAFEQCWRVMRDHWYDDRLGNRDWDAVRAKYSDMAAASPDNRTFADVVHLMLGELNGSHLGFRSGSSRVARPGAWREETAHLGLRFDETFEGPGLKVRDVVAKGPASRSQSRIEAGEIILAIDGKPVARDTDLSTVLNGRPDRDVALKVRDLKGKERSVTLRPISYAAARSLLYQQWIDDNRKAVDRLSKGQLGYLHISAMNMGSFYRFEEDLYAAGAGRDGLVIDVRENGGGSTTDHLLTALTQPHHAIAVPRGGKKGYPQDRMVYATWNKPLVVLCNQNSFSNAEIFSHAIKVLKRGQLVGVPTAGGVISTGSVNIMDVGSLRLPFRGWYVATSGEDMELHGAVPHHVVWPKPGEMPRGKDVQIERAVKVLLEDVKEWRDRPQPGLRKATERPGR